MILEKEKAVKNVCHSVFQNLKPGGPAPKAKSCSRANPRKPSAGLNETEEAASVKPKPNPNKRPEDKKGKGKGDGKDRGRSAARNPIKRSLTRSCWIRGNCPKGKDCASSIMIQRQRPRERDFCSSR